MNDQIDRSSDDDDADGTAKEWEGRKVRLEKKQVLCPAARIDACALCVCSVTLCLFYISATDSDTPGRSSGILCRSLCLNR